MNIKNRDVRIPLRYHQYIINGNYNYLSELFKERDDLYDEVERLKEEIRLATEGKKSVGDIEA